MEQLSLFDNISITKEEFAQRICDEFNSLDTVWKGTFKVKHVGLCVWEHIDDPEKVLEITIKPTLGDNYLMQFKGDKKSQEAVYRCDTPYLNKLEQDKDFSICITPWDVYVFYHKFERKKL